MSPSFNQSVQTEIDKIRAAKQHRKNPFFEDDLNWNEDGLHDLQLCKITPVDFPAMITRKLPNRYHNTQHDTNISTRRQNELAAAAARLVLIIIIIIPAEAEEEARESLDFVMCLEKVNGLFLVALYFGGCRVLGCIVSCDLMVWING